jgi:hypothetical protein
LAFDGHQKIKIYEAPEAKAKRLAEERGEVLSIATEARFKPERGISFATFVAYRLRELHRFAEKYRDPRAERRNKTLGPRGGNPEGSLNLAIGLGRSERPIQSRTSRSKSSALSTALGERRSFVNRRAERTVSGYAAAQEGRRVFNTCRKLANE